MTGPGGRVAATSASAAARPDATTPAIAITADTRVWVVDGLPEFHAEDCGQLAGRHAEAVPFAQAVEDGFTECPRCSPVVGAMETQVWVLDGRPDYHLASCSRIAHADSAAVPRSQAVADGFAACEVCHPDRIVAAEPVVAATGPTPAGPDSTFEAPRAAASSVWVVDGRPRYHLQDCLIIKDQGAEPIPLAQATEDGFMPCSMCEPSVTRV
jgi:hypothetical protein